MNHYITGNTIRELREKKQITQKELAQILGVSDKTISKWETAKGYPDISLLEPLAAAWIFPLRSFSAEIMSRTRIRWETCCAASFISARYAGILSILWGNVW